ncbi:hypothetical protein, conserved [Eimeria necatrix]|uniref:Uncharacterized protein n=1 Tax=Eimeria necatrix TaxID=51315 RepID=U6MGP2_9EIME|nr:hypothetical protein, conserved [Eimeria necatrix]CDJ63186.1 hypothetical protein, conserved [Eimeria necatrix]
MPEELTAAIHNSQSNSILTISKTKVLSWDAAQGEVSRVGLQQELAIGKGRLLTRKFAEALFASNITLTIHPTYYSSCTQQVLHDADGPDVTAASLDSRKRKLYLGDSTGGISCFNASTGAELSKAQPHSTEITHICPWPGTKCFVSASSDGLVLVQEEVTTTQVTELAGLSAHFRALSVFYLS